jgi:hypothetical protein
VEAAQRARDLLAEDWQSGGRWNDYGGGEVGAALDAALDEASRGNGELGDAFRTIQDRLDAAEGLYGALQKISDHDVLRPGRWEEKWGSYRGADGIAFTKGRIARLAVAAYEAVRNEVQA